MPTDFCEHLEDYGVVYTRAQASYRNCVHLLDTYLDDLQDNSLAESLTASLKEWLAETGMLRHRFKMLVEEGAIEMVKNPEAERKFQGSRFPLCGECAFQVPRLEFDEFQFDAEGGLLFREKPLPLPDPEKQEADTTPAPELVR